MFRVSARTLLRLFGLAVVLGLVALYAAWTFRFELLEQRVAVTKPFRAEEAPAAPDYDDPRYWSAWPGKPGFAALVPRDLTPLPEAARKADVFYVHATTLDRASAWNASLDDAVINEVTDQLYTARHASVFNSCCRIFVPRWRQATLFASRRHTADTAAAMALAYRDVEAAFERFLEEIGDRPFILASHSQGSLHMERLLATKVAGSPLEQRLIVAYMIGYWTPERIAAKAFPSLPVCESAAQTMCVVSWDSYGEGRTPFEKVDVFGHWDGERYAPGGEGKSICVNPLSWEKDGGPADAASNKGALAVDYDLARTIGPGVTSLPPLQKGLVSAQCRAGRLYVPVQDGLFAYKVTMPSYHRFDWGFFYGDLWANAALRTDAWLAAR